VLKRDYCYTLQPGYLVLGTGNRLNIYEKVFSCRGCIPEISTDQNGLFERYPNRRRFTIVFTGNKALSSMETRPAFTKQVKDAAYPERNDEVAKKKAYYHLWWHPHNFGNNPRECLNELKQIVQHYHLLNKKYGMKSMTMGEITEMLLKDGKSAIVNRQWGR
jgi:hypothetical protein